jgi:hypothetical protein
LGQLGLGESGFGSEPVDELLELADAGLVVVGGSGSMWNCTRAWSCSSEVQVPVGDFGLEFDLTQDIAQMLYATGLGWQRRSLSRALNSTTTVGRTGPRYGE